MTYPTELERGPLIWGPGLQSDSSTPEMEMVEFAKENGYIFERGGMGAGLKTAPAPAPGGRLGTGLTWLLVPLIIRYGTNMASLAGKWWSL
jgi:hypothetical protein